MKKTTFLFYLCLALLPTQLGRHFFFNFSLLNGIRSDYLAPTIYLTDIIAFLLIGAELINKAKNQFKNSRKEVKNTSRKLKIFLFSIFCYLLFTSIFITSNQWAALYKLVKITEFMLLGWVVIRIKPNILTVLKILSFTVFYSSIIAFGQFISQKSLDGFFWFLGERTFYAGTPGIAASSIAGRLILRPYATFPHPNVLGGFLAIILPLLLAVILNYRKKLGKFLVFWFWLTMITGFITLVLSFSRAAWIAATVGFLLVFLNNKNILINWLRAKNNLTLILFYGLIFFSIVIPLIFPQKIFFSGKSFQERSQLTNVALILSSSHPYFGVGLNNFIVQSRLFINLYPNIYSFQPVHNIYLLVLTETGLVGFLLFLVLLIIAYRRSFSNYPLITIALIQIYFLGFFDHYLFTLQQGQLLFTVFISLALMPRNKVN